MFLAPYFSEREQGFEFTRQQASHFAKLMAEDFNPIHDQDNKRFCVPGDLLFAVLVQKQGVSKTMRFDFSGMVNDGVLLHIKQKTHERTVVVDNSGKEYLHMKHQGEINKHSAFCEHIIRNYVQFSGMNFPQILVPLMQQQQTMINCQRPLVIYESMEITFKHLDLTHPEVEFSGATFDVEGKRGMVTLNFDFKEDGILVGKGEKHMVASGLRPYEQNEIDDLIHRFSERKKTFLAEVNQAA